MKYLVQRPFEDEVLVSCLIRTCRRFELPILNLASHLAGGLWRPSFFSISHIPEVASALHLPAARLLLKHTHFPYSTYFFDTATLAKSRRISIDSTQQARPLASVSRGISLNVKFRRYCLRCAASDLKCWGSSYWHREHNLPGVVVCSSHWTVLRETEIPTTSKTALDLRLPHEVSGTRMAKGTPSEFQLELAKQSIAVLQSGGKFSTALPRDVYRGAFVSLGVVSPDRKISQERLANALRRVAGPKLGYLGLHSRDESLHWAALMTRGSIGIPFATLKHLLLRAALKLLESGTTISVQYRPIGASPLPTNKRDVLFSKQVRRKTRQLVLQGKKAHVRDVLSSFGAYEPYRHNPARYPRLSQAVLEHRLSQASIRVVPKR